MFAIAQFKMYSKKMHDVCRMLEQSALICQSALAEVNPQASSPTESGGVYADESDFFGEEHCDENDIETSMSLIIQ